MTPRRSQDEVAVSFACKAQETTYRSGSAAKNLEACPAPEAIQTCLYTVDLR